MRLWDCDMIGHYPSLWELCPLRNQTKPDPVKCCAFCNKPMERKRYNGVLESNLAFRRRKYCDPTCMGLAHRKEDPTRDGYRKRIYPLRKERCEKCGTMEKLSIHHMDRNWRNNDPANLQTLCSSCHTSLHHEANDIQPPKSTRPCQYCGHVSNRTTCESCKTRIRLTGSPYQTPSGRRPFTRSPKPS